MDNYRAGLSHQQQLRMFNHSTATILRDLKRCSVGMLRASLGGGLAVQLAWCTVHLLR